MAAALVRRSLSGRFDDAEQRPARQILHVEQPQRAAFEESLVEDANDVVVIELGERLRLRPVILGDLTATSRCIDRCLARNTLANAPRPSSVIKSKSLIRLPVSNSTRVAALPVWVSRVGCYSPVASMSLSCSA